MTVFCIFNRSSILSCFGFCFFLTEQICLKQKQNKKDTNDIKKGWGDRGSTNQRERGWSEADERRDMEKRKTWWEVVWALASIEGYRTALARRDKREITIWLTEAWQHFPGTGERQPEHHVTDWSCHWQTTFDRQWCLKFYLTTSKLF